MKRFVFLALALVSVTSCSLLRNLAERTGSEQQRRTPPPSEMSHPETSPQLLQRLEVLSELFEVKLTVNDNLRLYEACSRWLNVPYKWGGNSKKGVDCSGFVKNIFKQVYGLETERNSARILQYNCIRIERKNLREGDLVFFHTAGKAPRSTPTHVGIYLKNKRFIHVSAMRGVMVSNLSDTYFRLNWITGGRVVRRASLSP